MGGDSRQDLAAAGIGASVRADHAVAGTVYIALLRLYYGSIKAKALSVAVY